MRTTPRSDRRPGDSDGSRGRPAIAATDTARRADLDWLRVLAVLLLVPFHSALVFILDPGLVAYVKDTVQSDALIQLKDFLSRWQLELLFFIAGAASWFALGRRSAARYLAERVQRLLVPFLFGLFVLIPFMLNVRWLGRPDAPSLGQIYARFFTLSHDLTGMRGNFTPAHLWFILYLFLFSVVGLPIFLLLRLAAIQRGLAWLAALPGAICLLYLVAIPLALARSLDLLGMNDKDPLYYFLVLLAGYAITSQPRFQAAIDRSMWLSFALALAATLAPQALPLDRLFAAPAAQLAVYLLFKLSQWTWVLAILGAGHRWLNRDSPGLRYASDAAYPFYILHLPIDTLVAFYVVQIHASVAVKYTLLVVITALATVAVYDLLVKRVSLLRFCFGMKPLARAERQGRPEHQAVY